MCEEKEEEGELGQEKVVEPAKHKTANGKKFPAPHSPITKLDFTGEEEKKNTSSR